MLLGREGECERIERLLDDARTAQSRTLVVRGEAGVGKSSLLEHAIARADGFLVLRAVGFESEAELAFSGLLQLCRPLLGRLDELPPHQSSALGAALGLAPAAEVDRLTIGVATLALLALAAEDTDLLVAVDDAQWVDTASIDAILFAARRFEADRIAVILTVREDATGFASTGVDELRLEGLGLEATRELLAAHAPVALAPHVADRLYELTKGNPLALVELPHMLTEAQLDGAEPFEQPLNLGTRVERAFRGRVEALSADAQQALLIASASESDRLDTIVAALARVDLDPSALQEAEDAGLVSLVAQALVFRHPLARSAVYYSASPSERRAAHAALAKALTDPRDIERRAWHLAAAAFAPDEEVAAALEHAADAARERSGYGGASAAYERAAQLTPAEEPRLRRLFAAADAAWLAGRTERAIALLDGALAECRDLPIRADMLNLRGHIGRHAGRPAEAYEMLVEAASLLDATDPPQAAGARLGAFRCCWMIGWKDRGMAVARALDERARRDGGVEEFCASLALGLALTIERRMDEARPLLERAEALAEAGDVFREAPRFLSMAGMASAALGDRVRGRRLSAQAVEWARERGLFGALPWALYRRATAEQALDNWAAAYASASESAALAGEVGQKVVLASSLAITANIEAMQGNEDACRNHVEQVCAIWDAIGTPRRWEVAATLPMLDLTLGRLDAAIAGYESLSAPPLADLIEAYVRSGRTADAEPLVVRLSESAANSSAPLASAKAARCRGLLADEETFEVEFAEALARHTEIAAEFEQARTRLCFGERLRRARRRREAREQLRTALEVFDRLGMPHWVERARAELRASGEKLQPRGRGHEQLTAQELRIAFQAAEGKTNRQIGATLYVSPKTVEFHLGRAYRKLGITSRAELIRRFATEPATGAAVAPVETP